MPPFVVQAKIVPDDTIIEDQIPVYISLFDADENPISISGGSGSGIPDGGATGEVLTKTSNADGDASWAPAGTVNTILYDDDLAEWPARPSDDDTVSYLWIGPTFPSVGGAGEFVANVDVFIPGAEVPGGGPAANQGVVIWDGTGAVPDRPDDYNSVTWITFDSGDDTGENAIDGDLWVFPT